MIDLSSMTRIELLTLLRDSLLEMGRILDRMEASFEQRKGA